MVANLSYKLLDGFSYSKEPSSFRSQRCTSTPADTDASVCRGDLSPVSAKSPIKGEKPKHSRVFEVPDSPLPRPEPEVVQSKSPEFPATNLEIEQELQVLVMKDDPTPTELAIICSLTQAKTLEREVAELRMAKVINISHGMIVSLLR